MSPAAGDDKLFSAGFIIIGDSEVYMHDGGNDAIYESNACSVYSGGSHG
jgi:hypothetical protein